MRQTWLVTLAALAALAGGSFVLFLLLRPAPLPEQLLYGNGHIEGTEVRVSAEVSGRVVNSTLVEGTTVEAGASLVHVDPAQLELERGIGIWKLLSVRHLKLHIYAEAFRPAIGPRQHFFRYVYRREICALGVVRHVFAGTDSQLQDLLVLTHVSPEVIAPMLTLELRQPLDRIIDRRDTIVSLSRELRLLSCVVQPRHDMPFH